MSNNTNTPPAWAMEAADEIIGRDNSITRKVTHLDGGPTYQAITKEISAQIISAHAPDAEALAVALEDGLQLFDGPRELTNDWHSAKIEIRKRMVDALSAYRAAHPKA